ncbi:MAG: hypothetical protein AAFX06_11060 [Planctomycetota bacterium]
MKKSTYAAICLLAMLCFVVTTGCNEPTDSSTTTAGEDHDHDHGDHDHDHDHGDHDHGDEHEGDDHADHDHGDHDHGDHDHEFETLADAMKEVVSLRDTIRDSAAEDNIDHGPLHHVFDVLVAAEKLVAKMPEDAPNKKAAAEAIETLLDNFGEVDAKLHGQKGKDYGDVSEAIDAAIAVLQKDGE